MPLPTPRGKKPVALHTRVLRLVLSGLSYDALHGVGNFVLMLLLYRPLRRALQMAKKLEGFTAAGWVVYHDSIHFQT